MTETEEEQQQQNQYEESSSSSSSPPTVHFRQDWDVGLGGGIWSTSLAMSKYFQQHTQDIYTHLTQLLLICNKTHKKEQEMLGRVPTNENVSSSSSSLLKVLELGSGNGYLSCCFAHYFGSLCQVRLICICNYISLSSIFYLVFTSNHLYMYV